MTSISCYFGEEVKQWQWVKCESVWDGEVTKMKSYCTISWIRELPRNRGSVCECHRLLISLLGDPDDLFSILAIVLRACALTCATEADNTAKRRKTLTALTSHGMSGQVGISGLAAGQSWVQMRVRGCCLGDVSFFWLWFCEWVVKVVLWAKTTPGRLAAAALRDAFFNAWQPYKATNTLRCACFPQIGRYNLLPHVVIDGSFRMKHCRRAPVKP